MVEDFVGRVDAPQNNADNDNWSEIHQDNPIQQPFSCFHFTRHLNEDMPLEEILGLHGI